VRLLTFLGCFSWQCDWQEVADTVLAFNRIYSALNALGLYNKNAKILFLVSLTPAASTCDGEVVARVDKLPFCFV